MLQALMKPFSEIDEELKDVALLIHGLLLAANGSATFPRLLLNLQDDERFEIHTDPVEGTVTVRSIRSAIDA